MTTIPCEMIAIGERPAFTDAFCFRDAACEQMVTGLTKCDDCAGFSSRAQRVSTRIRPMPWTMTRRCPFCGSHDVARSERYDSFEIYVVTLFLQRPYRCLSCQQRHYNFMFSKRAVLPESEQESSSQNE